MASSMDPATLSLIYQTLAASVPNQKGLSSSGASTSQSMGLEQDYEEIRKLIPPIGASEIDALERSFSKEIPCLFPSMGTIYAASKDDDEHVMEERVHDTKERVHRVREMYDREIQLANSLQQSIDQKLREKKLRQRESDLKKSEAFKMKEKLVSNQQKFAELQGLCRDIQTQCKDAQDSKNKLVLMEKDKTDMLEVECRESIDSVMEKIAEDQVEIDKKLMENEGLKRKLEKFKHNLDLLRDRAENEKKVADLTQKLTEAKKAQYDYNQEQQRLKENSVKAKLRHQEEVIHQLKKQIKFFDAKFVEFETTITQSRTVLEAFEEKKAELEKQLDTLKDNNAGLVTSSKNEDVKLIGAMQRSRELRDEVAMAKAEYEETEKKCRELQAARKQALSNAPPPAPSTSSASTSSAVVPPPLTTNPISATATRSAATPIHGTATASTLPTEVGIGSPVSSPSSDLSRKSPPR